MPETRTSCLRACAIPILCLGIIALVSADRASAQDEPIRLQKKYKPATSRRPRSRRTRPRKKKHGPRPRRRGGRPASDPEELEKQVQETINRLSKNLHTAEGRLNKKDPGESTQQVQKDIIKDLD